MWLNPQETADVVTFTEKILIKIGEFQDSPSIKAKQKNNRNKVMDMVITLHRWEEILKKAKSLILL